MKISYRNLWIYFAIFFCLASIFSTIFLYSNNSNSEEPRTEEERQIKGALAALNDPRSEVITYVWEKLDELEALDLIKEEHAPKIVELLKDDNPDVRGTAVWALSEAY